MNGNVNIGEKILALRKQKGITQAELGGELNVSYQAVSKWERGESFPDFETMSRMAKFFGVPLSYFEEGGVAAAAAASSGGKRMAGVCTVCGRTVYEGEEGQTEPVLVCRACTERQAKEKQEAQERATPGKAACGGRKSKPHTRAAEKELALGDFAGGRSFCGHDRSFRASRGVAVRVDCRFVRLLFYRAALLGRRRGGLLLFGKVVGTPGIIFEFSLDGFIFLIAMKILFALLRLLIFLLTALIGILAGIFISPFTFFPALHRVRSEDPAGA